MSYELRNHGELRPPGSFLLSVEQEQTRLKAQATRRRAGKKSSITKQIKEISKLIVERGSRTKLRFLSEKLQETFQKAIRCHEELMTYLEPEILILTIIG